MAEALHSLIPNLETLEVNAAPIADSYSTSRMNVINFSHIWTIEDFSFFLEKDSFTSEPFSAGVGDGVSWYLQLYPKGFGAENEDFIGISLKLGSSKADGVRAKSEIFVPYTTLEKTKMEFNHKPLNFSTAKGWCSAKFLHRELLFMNAQAFLPGDTLTICCKISYVEESVEIQSEISATRVEMSRVIDELFKSGMFADTVLAVKGKEFPVHKAFLSACSPMFKALFVAASGEQSSRIEFAGLEADELEELLRFVYTGRPTTPESIDRVLNAINDYISERGFMITDVPETFPKISAGVEVPDAMEKILAGAVLGSGCSRLELNNCAKSPDYNEISFTSTEDDPTSDTTSYSEDAIDTKVAELVITSDG